MLTSLVSSLPENNKQNFKTEPHSHLRGMLPTNIVTLSRLPAQPVKAAKSLSIMLDCPAQSGPSGGNIESF